MLMATATDLISVIISLRLLQDVNKRHVESCLIKTDTLKVGTLAWEAVYPCVLWNGSLRWGNSTCGSSYKIEHLTSWLCGGLIAH